MRPLGDRPSVWKARTILDETSRGVKVGWGEKVVGRGVGRHPSRPLLAPGDEVVHSLESVPEIPRLRPAIRAHRRTEPALWRVPSSRHDGSRAAGPEPPGHPACTIGLRVDCRGLEGPPVGSDPIDIVSHSSTLPSSGPPGVARESGNGRASAPGSPKAPLLHIHSGHRRTIPRSRGCPVRGIGVPESDTSAYGSSLR